MTALYAIPIGFVKHKFAFFSEKICLNLAKSDMRMLYWKQMQEKQHPKGGMRVARRMTNGSSSRRAISATASA